MDIPFERITQWFGEAAAKAQAQQQAAAH